MTYRINQMDQLSALFDVVRRYPGGVPAMAGRLPTEAGNPMSSPHLYEILRGAKPLSVERQDLMIHYARQAAIPTWDQPLHAKAAEHGGIFVLTPPANQSPAELMSAVLAAVKEFGDLAKVAAADLADGRIGLAELREIEQEGYEAIAAIAALVELCREVNARGGQ